MHACYRSLLGCCYLCYFNCLFVVNVFSLVLTNHPTRTRGQEFEMWLKATLNLAQGQPLCIDQQ